MGIRGLKTYMDHSEFLKPHEFSNNYLVVDGINVAYAILNEHSLFQQEYAFGGDYDEIYAQFKWFSSVLRKCKITPIFIMQGSWDPAKLSIKITRRETTIEKLKNEKITPQFAIEVFLSVMRDMNFICIQSDREPDGLIRGLARHLECPVWSFNSNYFLYDVPFISVRTLKLTPEKYSNSDKYYMKCKLYNPSNFYKEKGINNESIPIFATVLATDIFTPKEFNKFFRIQSSTPNDKIEVTVNWFKNKNAESAKKDILKFLKEKGSEIFENKTDFYFKPPIVSEAVFNEITDKFKEMPLRKDEMSVGWPEEISKLIARTVLPGFLRNMAVDRFYMTHILMENLNEEETSHLRLEHLIKKTYTMITSHYKNPEPLGLYYCKGDKYLCKRLYPEPSEKMNLDKALKESEEKRLQLLCDMVGIPVSDLAFVSGTCWTILIMSFMIWVKEFKNRVQPAQIHAFIIMTIANKVVQSEVGYCRSIEDYMDRYEDELNKLQNMELTPKESKDFKQMLSNVERYECLLVQKDLMPLRQTTKESRSEYSISIIDSYSCFQNCLFYVILMNSLLNFPLPPIKLENFYSGTLLFNLFLKIKSDPDVANFGSILFSQTPNLNQIYKFLASKLSETLE